MKIVKVVSIVAAIPVLLVVGYWLYMVQIANPRVVRELTLHPDGERAQKSMLLTLPGGRRIPVNYLREDRIVYAGADGRWWKELEGAGAPVTLLVRGETLRGTARSVVDDPTYTQKIFAKLRPNAVEGFGTLVEIRLEPPEEVRFEQHERSVFSENGEDGVIEKIFEIIEPTQRFAVEFGAADGVWLSNTLNLIKNHGWGALLIEGNPSYAKLLRQNYQLDRVKTVEAFVYPGNIEILFEENDVPEDFDLLVIDIDSNDYYVWKVIENYRPKVVLIEINPYFPPPQLMVIDFHPLNFWDETDYFGASIESMIRLGKKKGYEPVYNTGGFNLFFVDREYYPRFGIKDNSATALYKKWEPKADQWNRAPQGRGDTPFENPFLDSGEIQIPKKFLFDR